MTKFDAVKRSKSEAAYFMALYVQTMRKIYDDLERRCGTATQDGKDKFYALSVTLATIFLDSPEKSISQEDLESIGKEIDNFEEFAKNNGLDLNFFKDVFSEL